MAALITVIETAGNIRAMELAYAITARGGSVVSAGLPAMGAIFSARAFGIGLDEKSILGSYMGSPASPSVTSRASSGFTSAGKLPVGFLKSGFLPLSEIHAGFDRLAYGTVLRQVLRPNM